MAEPKIVRLTRQSIRHASETAPSNECPMFAGIEEVDVDNETGQLRWECRRNTWSAEDYNGGVTWAEWFTRNKAAIDSDQEREWHLWCWDNRNNEQYPDAREYIAEWGMPEPGTVRRIKQRSHKAIAQDKRSASMAVASTPIAQPKK